MKLPAGFAIAFGEIRHRRLRPAGHAFRYRGFFLQVPVDQLDGARHGNWLFGVNRPALLAFHEADHGRHTGDGPATPPGVRDWIASVLQQAGIEADGQIRLHCFARMFGFVFKPVSFWFCHRRDGALMAVLAEVNNTFGQSHTYLLSAGDGTPLPMGAELQADKRMYVSPFCADSGRYRFRFLQRGAQSVARVDLDDEQGPLLVTSLSGRLSPLDRHSVMRALTGYPLFTFGVVARIHWQALRLWIKRVPLFRKPATPPTNVSHQSQ